MPPPAPHALTRLLIVDDETHLLEGLAMNFELEGYQVHTAGTIRDARKQLSQGQFDAIILDVMLPDNDGFSFCQELRNQGNLTPILMLTAKGLTDDRVTGLSVGADDYLTKPFELSELLARVHSLIRRQQWKQEQTTATQHQFRLGAAHINMKTHEITRAGKQSQLTHLEYNLLRYFIDHPNRIIPRDELQQQVWQVHHGNQARMVDNFVMRLRRHIEVEPTQPSIFIAVRGRGYKFVPDNQ